MTNLEYCIARRKAERKAFVGVLKAVPQDQRDYRPHPKSRSAAELAWTLACEESDQVKILDTGALDWKQEPLPAGMEAIVAAYERNAAAVDERLARIDQAGWQKNAKFLVDGNPVWEDTTSNMIWGFLFDMIHHRGQLSVYLRPMGAKVPAIYGPSADDTGQ
jgi:uncharacterized damage-inducible protein DinB